MGMQMDMNMSLSMMMQMLDIPMSVEGNFTIEEYLRVVQEYSEDKRWFSTKKEIIIISCFSFLSLVGLVGNGLVLYITSRRGCKQSSRNWFIMNLAASDILTCIVCNPLTVVRIILKNWTLGTFLCKLAPSLQTVYVLVSTFTMVALAGDRYRAIICHGVNSVFKRWVPFSICLIWLFSIGISSPMAFVHEIKHVQGFNENVLYSLCLERWESTTSAVSYTVSLLLLQYLSPLLAIVIIHLLIGNFLGKRFQHTCQDENTARRKKIRHRKNIVLLTSMAISFGVAWFPLHLVNAWATINYSFFQGKDFPMLHAICMMLAFSSVCMNPIIYGLLNTNFRRDLIKIYRGHQPRYSVYTDCTRRSSHNGEQVGLISAVPNDVGISNSNISKNRTVTNV